MHALINAFLRCLSFLFPPSWLRAAFCWWVGDECAKTPWPNPRARFKSTKPLIHQEVAASPAPAPAPDPAARGSRLWGLWQAVERVFGAPFAARERWCRRRRRRGDPHPPHRPVFGVAAPPSAMSSDVEVTAGDAREMGTQVTITVAIQAAEDEEPEPDDEPSRGRLDVHGGGGSCSEDEAGRHDKSSGAGTSGGELEEESWQPPDAELAQKLVAQIEYYLSDENLEHDAFLLKHVRRNKLGFVSVKLLTSFKKVKHLTRDWRTTAHALRQSALLELNDEGRKVRRKTAVPVFASESLPSRMLLLSELQRWPELGVALEGRNGDGGGPAQQERLMELLLKAFGAYGPIASVRVLKPGKDLPADLKKLSGRYAQLGAEECAIVEFEEVEAAVRAHEAVGGDGDGPAPLGLRVVLIGTKPPKKKVTKEGGMRKSRSLNSRVRELQFHADDSACSSSETESNPTSPRLARKSRSGNNLSPFQPPNNHLSPAVSPRSSPWSSPCPQRKSPGAAVSPLASEGRLSPEPGRRWADYSSDSSLTPCGSPWVCSGGSRWRRRRAARSAAPCWPARSRTPTASRPA
uniref:HTH La-type RNA-binding domain-containing protein n=1 Tax=Denticeps clupeoides TaxID=299321 RepID=A0AAY4CJT5_9TELE